LVSILPLPDTEYSQQTEFDFGKIFCENKPMANYIPEALRAILAEQYDGDQFVKIMAQVFQYGASVVFHPSGVRKILPKTVVEIQVGDGPAGNLMSLDTPSGEWNRLLRQPPPEIEIAVFPGNFGRGARGKHDKNS
jgi:hypothetical protein